MSEKCYDIGTIQAFLDGEIALDKLEAVSQHVAVCDDCAILLAEAEEESALAFSVLEGEFNTFVPTNRLWTKINDTIEKEKKPVWNWKAIFAFVSNPSIAGFAGLLIVVGLLAVLFGAKTDNKSDVAKIDSGKQVVVSQTEDAILPVASDSGVAPKIGETISVKSSASNNKTNKSSAIKANFSNKENNERLVKIQKIDTIADRNPQPIERETRSNDANLLGEESYVKTIATLTKSVNGSKDDVLKPAARFAFERDLAVTDDAIKKMKAEVARNPKSEAAKDVLRASYQNKIDLLNSVAEKSELMASLK